MIYAPGPVICDTIRQLKKVYLGLTDRGKI